MFGGKQPHGFTIIEVMIFLTITAGIAISVFTLMSGQIDKTNFNQGIHQFASQLQAITTNVENGYYFTTNNFTCSASNVLPDSYVTISGTPSGEGTNYGCTYLGRVIQFNPFNNPLTPPANVPNDQVAVVYTVVGRQYVGTTTQPTTLTATDLTNNLSLALPRIIGNPGSATVDSQMLIVPQGLSIKDVSYDSTPGVDNRQYDNLIGFFSALNSADTVGQVSGSSQSSLIPIPSNSSSGKGTEFAGDENSVYCSVAQMRNTSLSDNAPVTVSSSVSGCSASPSPTVVNPLKGVEICLESTALNNYYGIISIGGDSTTNQANPLAIQVKTYYDSTGSGCPAQ